MPLHQNTLPPTVSLSPPARNLPPANISFSRFCNLWARIFRRVFDLNIEYRGLHFLRNHRPQLRSFLVRYKRNFGPFWLRFGVRVRVRGWVGSSPVPSSQQEAKYLNSLSTERSELTDCIELFRFGLSMAGRKTKVAASGTRPVAVVEAQSQLIATLRPYEVAPAQPRNIVTANWV